MDNVPAVASREEVTRATISGAADLAALRVALGDAAGYGQMVAQINAAPPDNGYYDGVGAFVSFFAFDEANLDREPMK